MVKIDKLTTSLSDDFDMKDLVIANNILDMGIYRDQFKGKLFLS